MQFSDIPERTLRLWATIAITMVVLVVALVVIARSTDTPQSVFWGAVKNSMTASGVTIGTSGTESKASIQTLSQLDFGQHPSSLTLTTLQSGNASAKTEELTTPTAQYIRYAAIHRVVKGKPVNFSSVVGVWAKNASYKSDVLPPSFGQILLDQLLPLPLGNLTAGQRGRLLQEMQADQVYTVNFASAKKTQYNGQPVYTYKVSIQPVLYLQLIKNYAPYMDIHQLANLNPNNYDGEKVVTAEWTIDALSKELVRTDYGAGGTQTYSGWDLPVAVSVPTHTVSGSELQKRVGALL